MIGRRIRVLVVDDSPFMRAAIRRALDRFDDLEVVGDAADGPAALAQAEALQPDVVTMDVNMPGMDGVEAVRQLVARRPTPVVMLSAHTQQGARVTLDALQAGAVDFLAKPAGEVSVNFGQVAEELAQRLRAAAGTRPRWVSPDPVSLVSMPAVCRDPGRPRAASRVVVVGVSTGGPSALTRVLPRLPPDVGFSLVVVQHMPETFTAALAERLNDLSAISVAQAVDGDRPVPGKALIAPGGSHLELDRTGALRLSSAPPVNGCRPSADVTMESAARSVGRRAVGLVMTGMGRDGTAGLTAIRAAGGRTFAQDEASCVIYGMPRSAVEAGVIDEVVALDRIAARLVEVLGA